MAITLYEAGDRHRPHFIREEMETQKIDACPEKPAESVAESLFELAPG